MGACLCKRKRHTKGAERARYKCTSAVGVGEDVGVTTTMGMQRERNAEASSGMQTI